VFRLRSLRPVVAVFLSLLLVGAQQAAFAHMVGHIGAAGVAPMVDHDKDAGHGAAESLSHVCTTCVALAALTGGALPSVPLAPLDSGDVEAAPLSPLLLVVPGAAFSLYRARAPPAFS
jgi:hypothetical protein